MYINIDAISSFLLSFLLLHFQRGFFHYRYILYCTSDKPTTSRQSQGGPGSENNAQGRQADAGPPHCEVEKK